MVELCFEAKFGHDDITVWQDRFQAQLNIAYAEFSKWTSQNRGDKRIKRFTRCGFSMCTLNSWPFFKDKAHNCLVPCRWLERKCSESMADGPYAECRFHVLWAWVEWFNICLAADPDCLTVDELRRLDQCTKLLIAAHKK